MRSELRQIQKMGAAGRAAQVDAGGDLVEHIAVLVGDFETHRQVGVIPGEPDVDLQFAAVAAAAEMVGGNLAGRHVDLLDAEVLDHRAHRALAGHHQQFGAQGPFGLKGQVVHQRQHVLVALGDRELPLPLAGHQHDLGR
jgi:hypothetical protein